MGSKRTGEWRRKDISVRRSIVLTTVHIGAWKARSALVKPRHVGKCDIGVRKAVDVMSLELGNIWHVEITEYWIVLQARPPFYL